VLRIGLTGGIASGKSTVARMFAALGAEVFDTDDIAHELTAPGGPAMTAIIEAFGRDIITDQGALDRREMRRIIFNDSNKRRELEAILHPLIRETALARSAASKAPYVILVVPLLFETGFDRLVDGTLVVDCPESLQIERVVKRDQISRQEALSIIASQMNRDDRRARADQIIDSSNAIPVTQDRVAQLHERYLRLSQNCPDDEGRAE